MEPTTYGIVSIVPVIVLIVVALITKRTFESLLIATLLALILGYKGDWFYALIEQIQTVSAENVWVLLVVGLLGGLVGVLEKSRAAMGFTGVLSRFATTKKRSLLAEWLLSVVLFVDDYLNILATGSITKRLNDSHRIHRTMTAYVIGSTSAPVVVLIPLSSWSIYYASLIDTTGIVPEGGQRHPGVHPVHPLHVLPHAVPAGAAAGDHRGHPPLRSHAEVPEGSGGDRRPLPRRQARGARRRRPLP